MALSTQQQNQIIQLVQVMFDGAPGGYMEYLEGRFTSHNGDLGNLAAELYGYAAFLYPASLSNSDFASQFVEDVVGATVSTASKADVASWIAGQLGQGSTRADIMAVCAEALGSVPLSFPGEWGVAAAQFQNRTDVARYYISRDGDTLDYTTLHTAIDGVTQHASSATAAKARLDGTTGRVADGYISGATVFADLNGDGVQNAGELSTTTDAHGNFVLSGAGAFGRIVVSGGTDISTNLPFNGTLSATAGATVVNPLTTLVQTMVQSGAAASPAAAQAQVLTALGISPTVNLNTFDPIQNALGTGDAATRALGAQVQAACAQVANILVQGAAVLQGASSGTTAAQAMSSVASALAATFATASAPVNLAQASVLQNVLTSAAAATSPSAATAVSTLAANAATAMAATAASINTIMSSNPANLTTALTQIAQVQVVAQGDMATALQSGASSGSMTTVVSNFTGTALNTAVNTAVPGTLADGVVPTAPVPVTPEEPVTPPSGGGGGGGGGEPPAPTFTVTEAAGVVTFTGTATGDIDISVSGGTATFVRGGVTATTTVASITTKTIELATGQTLAINAADATALAGVTFAGSGTLMATEAFTIAQSSGFTFDNFGTVSYDVVDSVASIFTGAAGSRSFVDLLTETAVDLATHVTITDAITLEEYGLIDGLTNFSEANLTFDLEDSLANLVGAASGVVAAADSYSLNDATTSFEDMLVADALSADEIAMIQGASNAGSYTYSLADSLANLVGAASGVVAAADSYSLTDASGPLGALTIEEALIVDGASDAADYSYTVAALLADLAAASSVPATYTLSDASGLLADLSVAEAEIVAGATNATDYTYSLLDSLANLEGAGGTIVADATEYALTNTAGALADITVAQQALVAGATNAADYTSYSLDDSLAALAGAGGTVVADASAYSLTDAAGLLADLSVAEAEIVVGASNAADYTYSLDDSLALLAAAGGTLVADATAYSLTDGAGLLADISVNEAAILGGATNAGDYTYSLNDVAASIAGAITTYGAGTFATATAITHTDTQAGLATGTDTVADTFVFASSAGDVSIFNFEDGSDIINLAALTLGAVVFKPLDGSGNDDAVLHVFEQDGNTVISVDADDNATPEFSIVLIGKLGLTIDATDFTFA